MTSRHKHPQRQNHISNHKRPRQQQQQRVVDPDHFPDLVDSLVVPVVPVELSIKQCKSLHYAHLWSQHLVAYVAQNPHIEYTSHILSLLEYAAKLLRTHDINAAAFITLLQQAVALSPIILHSIPNHMYALYTTIDIDTVSDLPHIHTAIVVFILQHAIPVDIDTLIFTTHVVLYLSHESTNIIPLATTLHHTYVAVGLLPVIGSTKNMSANHAFLDTYYFFSLVDAVAPDCLSSIMAALPDSFDRLHTHFSTRQTTCTPMV